MLFFSINLCVILVFQIILTPQTADAEAAKWSYENTPQNGQMGKWVLAAGSDLQHLTISPDGTLFCYATPAGVMDRLFKSVDEGLSWEATGGVKDIITGIAASQQDTNRLYYTTNSTVYRSVDDGATFSALAPNPGGAGTGNITITSIDVNENIVAVSTRDSDTGEFGGVYLLDEAGSPTTWADTGIGAVDVIRVNYSSDNTIYAITTDETNTTITSRVGAGTWGGNFSPATLNSMVAVTGVFAFPDDISATGTVFTGIDTGSAAGDVFKITLMPAPGISTVTDLNTGAADALPAVDIASLAISGNTVDGTLIAGCAGTANVYSSIDGGITWSSAQKPPTGQSQTRVMMHQDYKISRKVFAVTTGTESAFSISSDRGMNWNQTSLIDTRISNIVDFAVASSYTMSPTVYMVTQDSTSGENSLWRRSDMEDCWQRVFCSCLPQVTGFQMVVCVPVYGSPALYLAGTGSLSPATWFSDDRGQTFSQRTAPCVVTAFSLLDENTLFVAGINTGKGVIYRSNDGGVSYLTAGEAGTKTIGSIAISPSFNQDKTLLAGNNSGQVYWSKNGGMSFEQVGQQLPLTDSIGRVNVIFDSNYSSNATIYAATDAKVIAASKERIFSFVVNQSSKWQSMFAGLPENALVGSLQHTPEGGFYALNGQAVVAADGKGGMLRSLSVTEPSFEVVTRGLDEAVTLKGLWANSGRLWTLDTKNAALLTITDYLTGPIELSSPLDKVAGVDTSVTLNWIAAHGVTEYEWQVSENSGFGNIPAGFSGFCAASTVSIDNLKPGTVYYWRVRATKPFRSIWAPAQTFLTVLGGTGTSPGINQPANGSVTGIKPIFQWGTVPGADRYELVVSQDADFQTLRFDFTGGQALKTNAWQCPETLEYDTAYFWKIRACTENNFSTWSAVNAFITSAEPVSEIAPATANLPIVIEMPTQEPASVPAPQINIIAPENPTPVYSPTNIVEFNIPSWGIYSFLGLLGTIVFLLVVLIVLVNKIGRY